MRVSIYSHLMLNYIVCWHLVHISIFYVFLLIALYSLIQVFHELENNHYRMVSKKHTLQFRMLWLVLTFYTSYSLNVFGNITEKMIITACLLTLVVENKSIKTVIRVVGSCSNCCCHTSECASNWKSFWCLMFSGYLLGERFSSVWLIKMFVVFHFLYALWYWQWQSTSSIIDLKFCWSDEWFWHSLFQESQLLSHKNWLNSVHYYWRRDYH